MNSQFIQIVFVVKTYYLVFTVTINAVKNSGIENDGRFYSLE